MPRDRFFIAGDGASGQRVELAPDDVRKLVIVLRRRTGDRVQIVDGRGAVFDALLDVAGKSAHVRLLAPVSATGETQARIVLAQGIPKGQKMDFIVEKATELGVAAIVPLRSARVIGERTGDQKHERWQRIAKTAAQQSGRTRVPVVEPIADLDMLCATMRSYQHVYMAWEKAPAAPLRDRFEADAAGASSILVVIGPEGGFAANEVAHAEAAGAIPISLGPRILRTETAALVVIAALLYAHKEL